MKRQFQSVPFPIGLEAGADRLHAAICRLAALGRCPDLASPLLQKLAVLLGTTIRYLGDAPPLLELSRPCTFLERSRLRLRLERVVSVPIRDIMDQRPSTEAAHTALIRVRFLSQHGGTAIGPIWLPMAHWITSELGTITSTELLQVELLSGAALPNNLITKLLGTPRWSGG